MALLEEVFRLSGVPTHTFVEPVRYDAIKVSVRTPGRCIIIEGPSGIGKTTTVSRIIDELNKNKSVLSLSARRKEDLELITALPGMKQIGTVLVDDFHRLPDLLKASLSDYMKLLADGSDPESQLLLIGINKAGDQLIRFAHDLGMRLDVFKMESNPSEKLLQLIAKGEVALNVNIRDKEGIARRAQGSFHITQVLCYHLCLEAGVTETQADLRELDIPVDLVIEQVMTDLTRQFMVPCIGFAGGSRIRREGRAPYLHILKWLSEADDWSLDLQEAIRKHPEHRGSIGQVIDKGHLETLLREKSESLGPHFHYENTTRILSVEDPKLVFFLRNLVWRHFAKKAGFSSDYFEGAYDFALSFAGSDREIAKRLFDLLTEREIVVFYDENEQHRIIARNIEQYLAPIYKSEARYVIPLLSPDYPTRIWTKFESEQFADRFGENAVIPIRLTNVTPGLFSEDRKYGGLPFDPSLPRDHQLNGIVDVLARRLQEDRDAQIATDQLQQQEPELDL